MSNESTPAADLGEPTISDADDLVEEAELPSTWQRHPADVARLVLSLAGFVAVAGLMAADPTGAKDLGASLLQLVDLLPSPITSVATGIAQVVALLAPSALLIALIAKRRLRVSILVVAAGSLAGGATLGLRHWLSITNPPFRPGRATAHSWVTGALFPSAPYLAGAAAVITVLIPMLPRRWHRTAWLCLLALAGLRLMTAVAVPNHVATATLLGISIGSAVLVTVGAPRRRMLAADVRTALRDVGHEVSGLTRSGNDRFSATLASGFPVELRVVDRDARDADLLFRLLASAQRRGIENDRFTWSPIRRVDHEALASLLAAQAGVPVQPVLGAARIEDDAGFVLLGDCDATPLAKVDSDQITDEVLDRLWAGVRSLHEERLSHGQLHLGNVLLRREDTGGDRVLIGDLSRAVLSADVERRSIDVAELLVSTALAIGPPRAVAAAKRGVPEELGAALPLLQPLALTPTTRQELRAAKLTKPDLLKELRTEVQVAASLDEVKMAELQRINLARAVSLFGTIVLVYVALIFISNWTAMSSALSDANWSYLPVIVTMAALTYPSGALSMMGAVTKPLPFSQTSQMMLGQAFLNRFTPANIGGMALRTRYLQNHGIDLPVAASSIGLTSMASGMAQVVMIVGFFLWSGSGGALGFNLPDISTIAWVMVVLLAFGSVVWLTPLRKRILDNKLTLSVAEIWNSTRELVKRPGKLALLLGGATIGKLVTIVAFAQACRALGIDLPFAQIGALYMGANTVASAAPTPGGVGAMEAALVAVLTGAGVDPATALSAVLVFRLVTYWLPVPFSWLALRHIRSTNVV